MIKNILWRGLDIESLEYCNINQKDSITVRSAIVGHDNYLPFKLDYEIILSLDWVIRSFQIKSSMFNMNQTLSLQHDGYGKWSGEGKEWKNLEGCTDIDISVTPFTNTLPVRRLRPSIAESCSIRVVYIDIPDFRISQQQQHYTRINKDTYRFTNDSGDFTADIQMDEDGLVVQYPGLFDRILIRD